MRLSWVALTAAACAALMPGPARGQGADPAERAARIELAFVGDIMFGRFVEGGFLPIRAERHDPFARIRDQLRADLVLANLETPVLRDPPARSPWPVRKRFVATPVRVATLAAAGIRHVNLANNHADDMRGAGLIETPAILGELGITAIGAARATSPPVRVETVEVRGWRIGFVAATSVRNGPIIEGDPLLPHLAETELAPSLVPLIAAARGGHDLVIAVLHWGTEYRDEPAPWQVDTAHALIDAGADAVIGHHPHVLQPIERYRHGVIAYSLGNFVFDNLGRRVSQTGVLRLGYRAAGACLDRAVFHPAVIAGGGIYRPVPATGVRGREVRQRIVSLSRQAPYQTPWSRRGDDLEAVPACPSR